MIKINNNNNHRFKKLYANKYIENKLKKRRRVGVVNDIEASLMFGLIESSKMKQNNSG